MVENKKFKILITLLLIITIISTFSFTANVAVAVDEAVTEDGAIPIEDETMGEEDNAEDVTEDIAEGEDTSGVVEENVMDEDAIEEGTADVNEEGMLESDAESDIYQGDLYIADQEVTMDKLVNGNVYIVGKKVKVTGQISGNLFVCADELEFDDAYIEASVYAVANTINFKGVASDLYACCTKLNIPTDYGVYRDIKCVAGEINLFGIVGRDVYAETNKIVLQEGESTATIYGDLNYESINEVEIPEGSVAGKVNFKQNVKEDSDNNSSNIKSYIISAIGTILLTLIIYGLASLICKKSDEETEQVSIKKYCFGFLFGIIGLFLGILLSIILLILSGIISISPFIIYTVLYILLLLISTPIFNVSVSKTIINKFNIKNIALKLLAIAVVALVVYLIGLIPYVRIIKMLFFLTGFGLIITKPFSKNKKIEDK